MGNPSGSNRQVFRTVFKEDLNLPRGTETRSESKSQGQLFKVPSVRGITSGIVLLKDKAGGPILRLFKKVYPLEILERVEEWLSKLDNDDLVWDSTRNPYRLSSWIVAPPCSCRYVYAGQTWEPNGWTDLLERLREITEDALQLKDYFNSAVINAYVNGEGAVGMHADDEQLFGGKTTPFTIASISIGETRKFIVQENSSGKCVTQDLKHGDLVTMEAMMQATHKHGIPKSETAHGVRYNITFRRIIHHEHHCAVAASRPSPIFSCGPVV